MTFFWKCKKTFCILKNTKWKADHHSELRKFYLAMTILYPVMSLQTPSTLPLITLRASSSSASQRHLTNWANKLFTGGEITLKVNLVLLGYKNRLLGGIKNQTTPQGSRDLIRGREALQQLYWFIAPKITHNVRTRAWENWNKRKGKLASVEEILFSVVCEV